MIFTETRSPALNSTSRAMTDGRVVACSRFANRKNALFSFGSSRSKMSRVSMRTAPITAPCASSSANDGVGAGCAPQIGEARNVMASKTRRGTRIDIKPTRSLRTRDDADQAGGSINFGQLRASVRARVRAVNYIPQRFRLALLAAAVLVLVST